MKTKYLPYQHSFLKNIHDVKNLFVVVAMELEERALLQGIEYEEKTLGSRIPVGVKEFELARCKVIVGQSGVGLVNAGLLVAAVVERYPVDAIVLLGVGGALDEKLAVGDTVVSKQIVQHDSILSCEDGDLLIAPGELMLSLPLDQQIDPVMRCDDVLVKWIVESVEPNFQGNIEKIGKVYEGTILSGSEFVASASRKKKLRMMKDDALLVDMEAGALAQIARRLKIPFVAAKTVADEAKSSASVSDDYKAFLTAAAAHSAGVLKSVIKTFGN